MSLLQQPNGTLLLSAIIVGITGILIHAVIRYWEAGPRRRDKMLQTWPPGWEE